MNAHLGKISCATHANVGSCADYYLGQCKTSKAFKVVMVGGLANEKIVTYNELPLVSCIIATNIP